MFQMIICALSAAEGRRCDVVLGATAAAEQRLAESRNATSPILGRFREVVRLHDYLYR